jgi:2-amino-4-hydroxy-6-hydroxymethyldihydropteridine diphosphokinase
MAALARLPDTGDVRCSSLYVSAPVGVGEQPDYINAVCRIETRLSAPVLMRTLLDIERTHGRNRGSGKGAPRTLDLDLLLYGESVINETGLIVPHPRLHERAFALAPLAELDAALRVPGHGRVDELLARCSGQRVEKLES